MSDYDTIQLHKIRDTARRLENQNFTNVRCGLSVAVQTDYGFRSLFEWNASELPRQGDQIDINDLDEESDNGIYRVICITWKPLLSGQPAKALQMKGYIVVDRSEE